MYEHSIQSNGRVNAGSSRKESTDDCDQSSPV